MCAIGLPGTSIVYTPPNAGLQLRRATTFQPEGKDYVRNMLSRCQLQGPGWLHLKERFN